MAISPAAIGDSVALFVKEVASAVPVSKVILFGSFARGNPRADSDIDLAVVSPAFGRNPISDRSQLFKTILMKGLDSRIEPHPLTPADLDSPSSWIRTEILEHGIVVYDEASGFYTKW